MSYLLMIISGILGILGVVLDTHREVEKNGKKIKVLRPWGFISVVVLFSILCLSLYKEYSDNKKAEAVAVENEYLKLSEITVGPYYYFKIHFDDSLLNDNLYMHAKEKRLAEKRIMNWFYTLDSADRTDRLLQSLISQYKHGFLDSISRNILFQNQNLLTNASSELARIEINAGVINGYIDFEKDGLTVPLFYCDNSISKIINKPAGSNLSTIDTIESNFFYDKNALYVQGKIERNVRAGTVYGSILRQYEQKKSSSSFNIYFDIEPDKKTIAKINALLNQIKNIEFDLAYDPDAIRWLIILFRGNKSYELKTIKKNNKQTWIFSKAIYYEHLPHIGDISKN